MEVIRKKSRIHTFKARKCFVWGMKTVKPGDEIEIKNMGDQFGMVQVGKVVPTDLPETAEYICLESVVLPGRTERFEAKKLEIILLKAEDALRLMVAGQIIPRNEDQWRPNETRLRK